MGLFDMIGMGARNSSLAQLAGGQQPNMLQQFGGALQSIGDNWRMAGPEYERNRILKQNGGETPSNVKEYLFYNSLPPEQQQNYLRVKRAQQILDLGGTQGVLSPTGPGLSQQFEKTLPPQERPDVLFEQSRAEARGEDVGAKQGTLSATIDASQYALDTIEEALASPGFDTQFGLKGQLPNVPGWEGADAAKELAKIQGQAFLQAFNNLKGGGAISEREGEAATAAITNLNKSQSPESARKELETLRDLVIRAQARAEKGASASYISPIPADQVLLPGEVLPMPSQAVATEQAALGVPTTQPMTAPSTIPMAPKNGQSIRRKYNPITGKIE